MSLSIKTPFEEVFHPEDGMVKAHGKALSVVRSVPGQMATVQHRKTLIQDRRYELVIGGRTKYG